MGEAELKRIIGENVRRLRKARGLTQERFAELIDRTPGSVSRFESGKQFMGVDTLIQIANFFSVSMDELIRPEGTTPHFDSIINMLVGQSDEDLAFLEPFIRLWISQYGNPDFSSQ